jgi:glycosyltransferase involved in cell wall biosynthesis
VECWSRLSPRCRLVYNGFVFPEPALDARPLDGPSRIVLVGRLSPRKGQDIAIDAIAQLVREGYDVELELIGSAFPGYEWFERRLAERARRLAVEERVTFSGYRSNVWGSYAAGDVAIVPSRIEPFGNVAVEAMAMGTPVVVADVGGLPEIVQEGHTGLVVAPDDVSALAAALRRLLDDRAWASAMGRAASSVVRQRFTQERYEREVIEAVIEADASAAPRRAPRGRVPRSNPRGRRARRSRRSRERPGPRW